MSGLFDCSFYRYLFGISDALSTEVIFLFHLKCPGRGLGFSLYPLMNLGYCGGKLEFLSCRSIFVLVVGLKKKFSTSISSVLLINFLTDFALIKLLRVFSIMKGDNFVIGVPSIDSGTINLGKRVWSESLSESDSACGHFNFGFFAWVLVLFCIHGDFC